MTDRDKALIEYPHSAAVAASTLAERTLADRAQRTVAAESEAEPLTSGDSDFEALYDNLVRDGKERLAAFLAREHGLGMALLETEEESHIAAIQSTLWFVEGEDEWREMHAQIARLSALNEANRKAHDPPISIFVVTVGDYGEVYIPTDPSQDIDAQEARLQAAEGITKVERGQTFASSLR